jgi:excisionase family DNA binding protein
MNTNNHYTVAQAAELLGVSRQRVHQLIRFYALKVDCVAGLLTLIPKKELAKIPTNRTNRTRIKRKTKK